MLARSTFGTACLRALYSAVIAGLVAGLTVLQTTSDTRAAIITGSLAGLSILATRGGVEGAFDQTRQDAGRVSSADVNATVAPK
jgi:hypothetical protein